MGFLLTSVQFHCTANIENILSFHLVKCGFKGKYLGGHKAAVNRKISEAPIRFQQGRIYREDKEA